jgi:hypothetical protein
MIWAKLTVILFGHAIALVSLAAWLAICARHAWPRSLAAIRYCRRHPPLDEQEPPGWLAPLARAVLVLALVALGLATLLDTGAGSR